MFENPWRGRQARDFTTNVAKILDLKSSSEQIFSENCRWVPWKLPQSCRAPFKETHLCWCKELSDSLYIYNHETCLLSEFLNKNSIYLFPSKAYIKKCVINLRCQFAGQGHFAVFIESKNRT